MRGIEFKDHMGRKAHMSLEELHSAGMTHSYVEYALGMPLQSGHPEARSIKALTKRFDQQETSRIMGCSESTIAVANQGQCPGLWTEREINILKTTPKALVPRITGRTMCAVEAKATELGIRWHDPRSYSKEDDDLILSHTTKEAAEMLGRSRKGIEARRRKISPR